MKEQLLSLAKNENYEEINKLFSDMEPKEVASILASLEKEELVNLFPKIDEEIAAKAFILFSPELQQYLVENISDYEFKDVSEELLDNDVEKNVKPEVLNEIILKAETDTRHEKLLKIIDSLENKKFATLKPILTEMEPADIAEVMNDIDKNDVLLLFRLLPKDLASDVFVDIDTDRQKLLIESFTDKEVSRIINDLFVDDTADLIEEMPSNVVVRILRLSSPETRADINRLLGYPKDSAGSIMTTEFVSLRPHMTAESSLNKIRKQAIDKETIYTCYVTDDKKHLLGTVSAKDLILHKPEDKINDFMDENVISAHTSTDKEEVSQLLSKYDLLAVPIIDSENRITGIVTVDDAIDVIQDEANEDISKIAAIVPTSKPYLQTNTFTLFKSRLPWLLILLISATFTGLIINTYETTLNALSPLLFACIPMLMDSGGNAGSQASVTVIRALALDEIEFKDAFRILFKEFRVALLLALALSVTCFAKLQLIDNLIFGYNYSLTISLVVSAALFVTICIAKIIGAFLPLLAKKCKLDPAVVASPFITTIVDAISLLVYCKLAVTLL